MKQPASNSKPIVQPEPTLDQGRFNSAELLRALGYDDVTIQELVPGSTVDYKTMEPDTLAKLPAQMEAHEGIALAAEDGVTFTPDEEQQAGDFLHALGVKGSEGLAGVRSMWGKLKKKAGQAASHHLEQGSTNLHAGMATLDWATYLENWTKIKLQNPASLLGAQENAWQAQARAKYLPKFKFQDPSIAKEFNTTFEAAMWMMAQQGKAAVLDKFGYDEEAKALNQQMYGQLPQLIAGQAEHLPWLGEGSVMASEWDPDTFDDIYLTLQDRGKYGQIAMGAMAVGIAAEDMLGSPLNLVGEMPLAASRLTRQTMSKIKPAKHAKILDDIAERTHTHQAAEAAYQAAQNATAKAVQPEDIALAAKNEARAKQRMAQFEDPGQYEVIQLRTARRNPDFPIQPYKYQWDPISQQQVITGGEQLAEAQSLARQVLREGVPQTVDYWNDPVREATLAALPLAESQRLSRQLMSEDSPQRYALRLAEAQRYARQHTLREGPPLIVDWDDPQVSMATRAILGPDDAEYAGDALNQLVRGATVDDVTMTTMAPEYSVLPDVQTSLIDHRKLALNKKLAKAEQKAEMPHQLTDLDMLETEILGGLDAAKRLNAPESATRLRAELKRIRKLRKDYAAKGIDDFDESALPKHNPGIMQSPERHNNWIETAVDRVVRSAYPGGLNISATNTMFGQGIGPFREAQRYYMSFEPRAYERIRSSTLRHDQASSATQNLISTEAEAAGILSKRGKFNPKRHYSPYRVNKEAAREGYDLLNTRKDDPDFQKLYDAASPQMQRFHDRLRKVLDHYADLHGISDTDKYLEGYIHHVLDPSMFANGGRPFEMIGLPARGEVFARHLLARTKNRDDYERDAVLALDVYVRAANRKLLLEPMYNDILQTGVELAAKTKNKAHITYANDLVAGMRGTPSFLGAKIDEAIGGAMNMGRGVKVPKRGKDGSWSMEPATWLPGTIDRTVYGMLSMIHRALISGNPSYALVQIASGLSTSAGRYGPLGTARGVFMLATKEGQQLSKVAGTYRPFVDFLDSPTSRKMSEMFDKIPAPPMMITNSRAELVSRQITFLAETNLRMRQAGFKTIKEAEDAGYLKRILFESLRRSEEINHLYGVLGRSPWSFRTFGTSGAGAAQQFLSYIPKTTEELVAQGAEHPGYLLRWLTMSGWMLEQAAKSGVDMTETIGPGYWPDSPTDVLSPSMDMIIANFQLMEAMSNHDPGAVEKATEKLSTLLQYAIPSSQMVLKASQNYKRWQTETVETGAGNPLYRMEMGLGPREGMGIGKESVPTFFMQPNLTETLTRRGLDAIRQEEQRFGNNARNTVDAFVDAVMDGDYDKAAGLEQELVNPYRIRLTGTTMIDKAMEARRLSQSFRTWEGSEKLQDVNYKILKEHGINVQP